MIIFMSVISKLVETKKLDLSDLIGVGLNVGFAVSDYKSNRQEGKGRFASAAGAVGEFAIGELMGGPAMMAAQLATGVPKLATSAALGIHKLSRQEARKSYGSSLPFYNATFNDTRQAYTMRQAGMQLAENSKYNLQQSLMGNEAAMLHM